MILRKKIQQFMFATSISFITIIYGATPATSGSPIAVNVVTAQLKEWQPSIASTGTLVPEAGITIKSDIAGRITDIFFKSGTYVKKGQPLLQIFPYVLQAEVEQAKAKLYMNQVNFDRYIKLYKQNAASQAEYDTAQADYLMTQAILAQYKSQLDQTLIKAPFSGYLGIRQVNLGDYLAAGDNIVNLEDSNPMYVDFSVPEVYSKQVKTGQKVTVNSDTYGKRIFVGKVIALESLIDPSTRTLDIRAELPNNDNVLIAGSFVITNVFVGEPKQLILLPQTAIAYSAQTSYVYVVKNNKAIKTPVILGERGDTDIFIKSGLNPGDIVVTAGQQRLYDGVTVQIQK